MQAHARYSRPPAKTGAALLLADGTWVPGVRVENAAFPLVIPALTAAYAAARGAGRSDVVAVAQSRPFSPADLAFLTVALPADWRPAAPDLLVAADALPALADRLDPFLDASVPSSDAGGIALARRVAERAHIPESGFPVGCVLETSEGRLVPGCNVEHADWTRGLCAERVALATAFSYGFTTVRRAWLSCPEDASGTPCGACRQVLFELAPGVPIVMDRGDAAPETTTPEALLPGGFRGDGLRGEDNTARG